MFANDVLIKERLPIVDVIITFLLKRSVTVNAKKESRDFPTHAEIFIFYCRYCSTRIPRAELIEHMDGDINCQENIHSSMKPRFGVVCVFHTRRDWKRDFTKNEGEGCQDQRK